MNTFGNNFGDDDADLDEMEDSRGTPQPDASPERDDDGPDPDAFWNRKWVRIPRLTGMGVFIIGTALALYWTRIPDTFDVQETARAMAVEREHRMPDQALPRGYETVSTMITLAEQLFDKPGGYQSNDINPVTRIPDNMRNWEYGYVVQLRVLIQGLRFDLSRAGPQAVDHQELREAESRFNFKHDNFVLPSTQKQYRQGIDYLRQFLDKLNSASSPGKFFTTRNDQLISYLERQKNMLGNYTTRLQDNIGVVAYDTGILTSAPPPPTRSWRERSTPTGTPIRTRISIPFSNGTTCFTKSEAGPMRSTTP